MNLRSLMRPRSVAVVGASRQRHKVGYAIVRNLKDGGFRGRVTCVNPHEKNILGYRCVASIDELPRGIDCAIIALPAALVPGVIRAIGKRGIRLAIVIASGFSESGPEGVKLQNELVAEARAARVRILGPNCLGMTLTETRCNASFANAMPTAGPVSLISQSGAINVAVVDTLQKRNVGFHVVFSIGNAADISAAEMVVALGREQKTSVIGLYLENASPIGPLADAIARVSRTKTVVVLHAGSSEEGRKAVSSHTGRLATPHAVLSGLLRQAGAVVTRSLEEFTAGLEMAALTDRSDDVIIVTNGGGPGVLALDAGTAAGAVMHTISDAEALSLRKILPPASSINNPVDILGDADEKRLHSVLTGLHKRAPRSAIQLIITPQSMTPVTKIAHRIARYAPDFRRRLSVSLLGGSAVESARRVLRDRGVFEHQSLSTVMALYGTRMQATKPARLPAAHYETKAVGMRYVDQKRVEKYLRSVALPFTPGFVVRSLRDISRIKNYPVVAKAIVSDVVHKRAAGAVKLNIPDSVSLKRVYSQFEKKFSKSKLQGMLVQPMREPGLELLIGFYRDPDAGPLVGVGMGGSLAEQYSDIVYRRTPLSAEDCRDMIGGLTHARLLTSANRRDVVAVLKKVSLLVSKRREIIEMDLNPFTLTTLGGSIIDARIGIQL